MGLAQLGRERDDDAINLGRRALKEKDPRWRDLFLLLAKSLDMNGSCRPVHKYYLNLLKELDPKDAEAVQNLRWCP